MRVTVLAFFFPPVNQVGYKRPLRLVDWLCAEGHEVTVYAVSPDTPQLWNWTGVDPDLEKIIPPGALVVRTWSIHPIRALLGLRDRLKGRRLGVHGTKIEISSAASIADTPPAARSPVEPAAKPQHRNRLQSIVDLAQSWFEVPDPYWGWILTTLPGLLVRSILHRPRFIYVTAPPWSPLLAAVIAGKLLRIPVHADFRDPWTINKYWKAKRISRTMEAWVMKNCASVIANTDSMGASFLDKYPSLRGKLSVVYNGYDEGTAKTMSDLRALIGSKKREFFTLTHIGMLYPNRMPQSLATCLADVAANWSGSRPLRLRFVGNVMDPTPLLEEFSKRGVTDTLEFTGEVNTVKAREEEVLADVLLLLQSGTMEQIPAKIFEYAFAGVPILCVADRGSETSNLVARHGLGVVLHGGEKSVDWEAKLVALDRPERDEWSIPEKFLEEFSGPRLAEKVLHWILSKN